MLTKSGKSFRELCPDAPQDLGQILEQCLKQNPNERPSTAVEVYLRLQELGKASGILLLPPGAMDRLIAARQAEAMQPTIAYDPKRKKGKQRRCRRKRRHPRHRRFPLRRRLRLALGWIRCFGARTRNTFSAGCRCRCLR